MGTGRMLKAAVIAAILPAGLAAQAGERLVCRDGAEPVGSHPAQFGRFIADEIKVWHRVIRESGVKVESRR